MSKKTHPTPVKDGATWSAQQWAVWVADKAQTRENTFINEPEEMTGAYNRENKYALDYHGRELLEALQNADDAGVDFGPNKALIDLSDAGVCVANTGLPFSANGIHSLMISNRSPKQLDRSQYIGNFGLGFRSVLAWTECPFILSGQLRLGFSRQAAAQRLTDMYEQHAKVRVEVDQYRRSGLQHPIPILACPHILNDKDLSGSVPPSPNSWSLFG